MLFKMLTDQRPFDGDSPVEIWWAIHHEPLPEVRDYRDSLPAGIGDVARRMLMRDVAARMASARQDGGPDSGHGENRHEAQGQGSTTFTAMGDEHRLLIVVLRGRMWFPDTSKRGGSLAAAGLPDPF